ncbi:MAG: electron transfer flavoprotein subunit alpha/FixB family protein [Fimbriimonadaceae bacterium]|nr:electron transfer flavoprotein subunit alpha/FixB family protein [Fimbriimonadaceae bacterium]
MKLLCVAFSEAELPVCGGLAASLGAEFDVLLVHGSAGAGYGAAQVMTLGATEAPTADVLAPCVAAAAVGYSHVVAVSSMATKDLMARAAGLVGAAMVTDVVRFEAPNRFVRPILAGSVLATVETLVEPVFLTFRAAGIVPAEAGSAVAVAAAPPLGPELATRVATTVRGGSRPDLAQAKCVVTGGRPLQDAETFERVIGGLADRLGAAVGATRAAVDSGIAPNELQVGQTGKIVAPDLYIAAGVSGSTQHVAGIKDSKAIVAINKDPDAPIFETADLGLVADLFEAIPEIVAKLGPKE